VTGTAQSAPDTSTAPELSDLEAPPVPTTPPTLSGPPVSPQLRVLAYESGEWEVFIREWATAAKKFYVQIKRLGGSNDHGVDVAAFKTKHGFEGAWDCFQGKHYAKELVPSDAYPEMLKVLLGVLSKQYILPDQYAFLAPKGCGTTLDRLLSKPTDLRDKFLEELDNDKGCAASLDDTARERVRELAKATDFSMFQSVQLADAPQDPVLRISVRRSAARSPTDSSSTGGARRAREALRRATRGGVRRGVPRRAASAGRFV